jgi:hypothetical protein
LLVWWCMHVIKEARLGKRLMSSRPAWATLLGWLSGSRGRMLLSKHEDLRSKKKREWICVAKMSAETGRSHLGPPKTKD